MAHPVRYPIAPAFALCAMLALAACEAAGESSASVDESGDAGGQGPGDGAGSPGASVDAGASGGDTAPPPEEEETFVVQAPRASLTFVFVANTTLDTVARIDSRSLRVTAVDVCLEPTEVLTLPTRDRAVALCQGDDRLAIIDVEGDTDRVRFASVAEGANRGVLDPGADYALLWYDPSQHEDTSRPPGNPNDLTLVRLGSPGEAPQAYLLSIGFGVRSVQFVDGGATAFVTTEDGLSIIDLPAVDRDQFVPVRSLGDDPLARAADREVLVTDDGALAFVRTSDFSGLRVLDVEADALSDIPLPAVPTDLDLISDGSRGIAVMREASAVAVMPLPDAVSQPESIAVIQIGDEPIGLAQPVGAGERVLLYSTAIPTDRVTLLDLSTGGFETFALRKEVDAVIATPDGERAVVLHRPTLPEDPLDDGTGANPIDSTDALVLESDGYTLFDLATGFTRLVLSPTAPDGLVFTEDGRFAFVMLEDAAADVREVQRLDFESFRADTFQMSRPPESIGVVPATGRITVSQRAATGRITFIDAETGEQQHVTAYHLNRRIE